jgi:uncharacterized protein involved in cysteine biosynthesis
MILSALSLALGQLGDPRFCSVLWRALGLTLALLVAFYVGFVAGLQWLLPDSFTIPWVGEVSFVDELLSGLLLIGLVLLSSFLMVPVASVFTGFFLEEIAEAVEARHYPALPPAPRIGLAETLADSARFLGVLLLANLLLLVGYLVATVFAPVLFWAVNGYLLGREYFQLVAMRRLGAAEARALGRRHWLTVWAAGAVMAVPLTVPVVNLAVPIVGVAMFTHLFQRLAPAARRA